MKKFKNKIVSGFAAGLIATASFAPTTARADLFGGDVVVLAQILANAVQQLIQLKQLLENGRDSLSLIKDINRGINDSLNMISTMGVNVDPGIYKNWNNLQNALQGVQQIYGAIPDSKEKTIQTHVDQNVAEAITLNNSIYNYSKDLDRVGENIKTYSHAVSPGGAQKLTAESLGVLITVMNQSLRAQATGLKLQAQALALQNAKDKEQVKHQNDTTQKLSAAMKRQETSFKMPRF
jgi:hypothetical protein